MAKSLNATFYQSVPEMYTCTLYTVRKTADTHMRLQFQLKPVD